MFVWRKRRKISRTVPYYIEYCSCTQNIYTFVNSSYRPSTIGFYLTGTTRLWLDAFACIRFCFYTTYYLLYCCNMVVWSWWDWNLIWTTISRLGHLTCKKLLLRAKRVAVKAVPEMTYNVSSGTLNSTLPCKTLNVRVPFILQFSQINHNCQI